MSENKPNGENTMANETDSVLLAWRDRLDHEVSALRQLEAEFAGMARAGESIGPEGAAACADLLQTIGDELTGLRMSIQGLASDAGESERDKLH